MKTKSYSLQTKTFTGGLTSYQYFFSSPSVFTFTSIMLSLHPVCLNNSSYNITISFQKAALSMQCYTKLNSLFQTNINLCKIIEYYIILFGPLTTSITHIHGGFATPKIIYLYCLWCSKQKN